MLIRVGSLYISLTTIRSLWKNNVFISEYNLSEVERTIETVVNLHAHQNILREAQFIWSVTLKYQKFIFQIFQAGNVKHKNIRCHFILMAILGISRSICLRKYSTRTCSETSSYLYKERKACSKNNGGNWTCERLNWWSKKA